MISLDHTAHDAPTLGQLHDFMLRYLVQCTGYPATAFKTSAALEDELRIDVGLQMDLVAATVGHFQLHSYTDRLAGLRLGGRCSLDDLIEGLWAPRPLCAQSAIPAESRVARTIEHECPVPIVDCSGTPYEIGLQHGRHQARQARNIGKKFIELLGSRLSNMPELDEAHANPELYFGPEEIEELEGLADGGGVPIEAAIAHNLSLYPEYIPGCCQVYASAASNGPHGLIHTANEDSPIALLLRESLSRVVQIRRPAGGHAMLTFSISGQIGGLNGINEQGLAVTTTLLLDCPRRDTTAYGIVHPVLVKKILETADSVEGALEVVRSWPRSGAWSLCISHHSSGRMCYLEYDGSRLDVRYDLDRVATSNHCILLDPVGQVPDHSRHRLQRLEQLLSFKTGRPLELSLAKAVLRDRFDPNLGRVPRHPTKSTIRRVDNQASIVMLPALGEVWLTPGPMAPERENEYFCLNVDELLQPRAGRRELMDWKQPA